MTDLTRLKFVVLDEADQMIKSDHYRELTQILSSLPKSVTYEKVTLNRIGSNQFRSTQKHEDRAKKRASKKAVAQFFADSEEKDGALITRLGKVEGVNLEKVPSVSDKKVLTT